MKYGICGAAFSGNKGAEGMLLALIQHISREDQNAEFFVMSYYPESDKRSGHGCGNVVIINGSPKRVVIYFFQVLWCMICCIFHLPVRWWKNGEFAQIADCDIFLDAAGISFSDGREKFTIFNILSFLPALAAGVKVVKVSQAMGPFKKKLNRLLARFFLPRMALIVARGKQTADYLAELNLDNTVLFSDTAFSLECTSEDENQAAALLGGTKGRKIIGISPSQVVWNLCQKHGVDYLGILKEVTENCRTKGFHCVIFPHSARTGTEKTHNNDLPLLKKFTALLRKGEDLTILEQELEAGVLRQIISRMDILVASRFHAIISAMSVGVPAIVVGWSHKYAEVLAPFDLDSCVQSYADFNSDSTIKMIEELYDKRKEVSEQIQKKSLLIRENNREFFSMVVKCARNEKFSVTPER